MGLNLFLKIFIFIFKTDESPKKSEIDGERGVAIR